MRTIWLIDNSLSYILGNRLIIANAVLCCIWRRQCNLFSVTKYKFILKPDICGIKIPGVYSSSLESLAVLGGGRTDENINEELWNLTGHFQLSYNHGFACLAFPSELMTPDYAWNTGTNPTSPCYLSIVY